MRTLIMTMMLTVLLAATAWAGDVEPPVVVGTTPAAGTADVDPGLTAITVTFSEPMQDKSWSWVYESEDSFPEMAGDPSFDPGFTTCTLPVKLEPGKAYVIWINSDKFNYFKDMAGNPATPYKLTFSTRQ